MKWKIQCKIWENEDSNREISFVFNHVAALFTQMIPEEPPLGYKPIVLVNDLFYDHRIYWPINPEYYKIGLNTGPKNYGKAAYEFTHELTHIYCDPRIVNWLTETISHLVSFHVLDVLAKKWEESPPEKADPYSYDMLRCYKIDMMREAYHKIDLVQHQMSDNWIKKEIKNIHTHPDLGNHVIYNVFALELLPFFEQNPEGWEILPYIGKSSTPSPPENNTVLDMVVNSQPDPDMLPEIVPDNLKPIADEIISKLWKETKT